jgi:hypothetical protein
MDSCFLVFLIKIFAIHGKLAAALSCRIPVQVTNQLQLGCIA